MSSRWVFSGSRWGCALLSGVVCGLLGAPGAEVAAEVGGNSPGEGSIIQSISGEVEAIFAKCKGSIVRIQATDAFGTHVGTGFFIDPNGTIYTHYSVGGASWNLTVEFADKRYPATCLLADPRSGAVLLKIEAGPTPFLSIGRSDDLKVASPLIAVGYPLDQPASPSFGMVAGFDQKVLDRFLATTHVRANMLVHPGEQGSPVLNVKGQVVGILVCRLDFGASCLALPIQAAEKVRNDYLRFGEPRPGWIGATVGPAPGGLVVKDLDACTPAARCGLENGDILLQVGARAIHHFADVPDASFFLTAEETVPIVVRRGDRTLTFQAQAIRPPGTGEPVKPGPADGIRLSLPPGH